jgi:hypothetical protein
VLEFELRALCWAGALLLVPQFLKSTPSIHIHSNHPFNYFLLKQMHPPPPKNVAACQKKVFILLYEKGL